MLNERITAEILTFRQNTNWEDSKWNKQILSKLHKFWMSVQHLKKNKQKISNQSIWEIHLKVLLGVLKGFIDLKPLGMSALSRKKIDKIKTKHKNTTFWFGYFPF